MPRASELLFRGQYYLTEGAISSLGTCIESDTPKTKLKARDVAQKISNLHT